MTATLWWVRHGPTHATGMVGWSDPPADLSDHGAIARLSAHLPPDAVVISSDLRRAVATADAIAGARPRLPHDPGLREIHFGAWERQRHDEIGDTERAFAFWDAPGTTRAPGGECWDEVRARVDAAADRLAGRGGDVVVVAHFGAILTQVQRATRLSGYETFGRRVEPLSVTRLGFDGAWHLHGINHRP